MAHRKKSTKIDTLFDDIEHVVERTERLFSKSKSLLFGLALLLLLIYELVVMAKGLIHGH